MLMKKRAPKNRTIELNDAEIDLYSRLVLQLKRRVPYGEIANRVINQNVFEVIEYLPQSFADLLFLDPPYNLTKSFNSTSFNERSDSDYIDWFSSWFPAILRTLKPNGSIYICADWRTSAAIYSVVVQYVKVRNRITWEREKGRGAKRNWKKSSEDILFSTLSDDYTFNTDAVKLKRRVLAPYTHVNGEPKDWQEESNGNFRLTYASNLWTDITVPFWSMPENTDHPTQKPEKLLAKIVLASTDPNNVVFDPFLGSGTSAVVAKKLGRQFVGVEIDPVYCALSLKRLDIAESHKAIQGYSDGVFWERNSANAVANSMPPKHKVPYDYQPPFFSV